MNQITENKLHFCFNFKTKDKPLKEQNERHCMRFSFLEFKYNLPIFYGTEV